MGSRIYLASSWRNEEQPALVAQLRLHGHEVYDFRNPPSGVAGFSWSELDPDWMDWDVRTYRQMLERHHRSAQGYMNDLHGMMWADTCVLLLPCGRSAHLEAGWFAGAHKRLIIAAWELPEPELMYLMADNIVTDFDELLEALGG